MRRMLTSAVLTAGFLLLLSSAAFAAEVSITDDGLEPERVEVDIREEIMWTNNTDEDVALVGEEPNWESGTIAPGATFSIQITQEGTYRYSAEDGSFTGQIVVGQAAEGGEGDGEGNGSGGGDDPVEEEPTEEPTEAPAEGEGDNAGGNGNGNGNGNGGNGGNGNNGGNGGDDEEALPMTGINATVPGALSVLLVVLGIGLLVATSPVRGTRSDA